MQSAHIRIRIRYTYVLIRPVNAVLMKPGPLFLLVNELLAIYEAVETLQKDVEISENLTCASAKPHDCPGCWDAGMLGCPSKASLTLHKSLANY